MRAKIAIAILLVAMSVSAAGTPPTRFYMSGSTVPSGAILKGLEDHCQNAILTLDASRADYVMRAEFDTDTPHPSTFLVLYDNSGDSLFQTETRNPSNAVKDACAFLRVSK